jgi:hypothetical protein
MTTRQQIFALITSLVLLVYIIDLVRRRKLREEYSWLWIIIGVGIFILSIWVDLLRWLTNLIGAVVPVSTLFIFGILFLVITNVYLSLKISTLTDQVKKQAQKLAILDHYIREIRANESQRSDSKDS